ncbi:uncharacterized protein LDX57_010887 [Aspergillus melleus]|uniref:uncharacterized protein n=1 Tax=Aspergillus melleus TaxID=138277 RepID=UPI001E8D604D|nr:uncharacterized protein LDX57_010887 [Aspergillus melleus]KAH8433252.1 hypothetical protein LDX57_010887 [Aspergillus melleus]
MLSSTSLGQKDRLRRTKSTRSIRRPRQDSVSAEPFDLETARQHATAAASLAMRRSTERSSLDSQRSYDRLGGPGSMAVPRRRHRPDAYPHSSADGLDATHTCSQPTDESSGDYDPMSLAMLPPISEFGGLDGRDSSLPSSYRRLRKTRSMFATGQRFSRRSTGVSSHSYAHPASDGLSPSEVPRAPGTLRRSLSFFRGDQGASDSMDHAASHNAAIQMARSQFQKQSVPDLDRYRHPSFLAGRPKREHKPLRKTFRDISTADGALVSTPSPRGSFNSGSSHARTRSFSSSIKRGIKRALGLSKHVAVPEHAQDSQSSSNYHPADPCLIKSAAENSSSNENAPPYPADGLRELTSPSASRSATIRSARSIDSFATTRSRVTSWADSSAANTITTMKAGDRGSLSVIDEKGVLSRKFDATTPDLPSPAPDTISGRLKPDGTVDSRRLYAALMKRIRGSGANDSTEEVVFGQVKEHRAVPTRASSLRPRRSRQTIRHIPSEDSVTSPKSFATARDAPTPQVQVHRRPQDPISLRDLRYLEASNRKSADLKDGLFESTKSLEDDTSGIIMASVQPRGSPSDSSSIYSRTTSGNTPPKKDQRANSHSSGPEDEPGVATIYASQRSAYSSPNRDSVSPRRVPSLQPSADWQQWMRSQMERIEDFPARRDHYREDAQIYGEDDFPLRALSRRMRAPEDGMTRQEDSARPSYNYSRPFSRSSSVRTIVNVPREQAGSTAVPSPSAIPILYKPSGSTPEKTFSPVRGRKRDGNPASAPMQLRPSNRIRYSISPTPKRDASETQQKMAVGGLYDRYQTKRSPVPHDGKTLYVRSVRGHRDAARVTNENLKANQEQGDFKDPWHQPPGMGSPVSSKRMVEMFLNSRRQQMGTGMLDEDKTSDGAFV